MKVQPSRVPSRRRSPPVTGLNQRTWGIWDLTWESGEGPPLDSRWVGRQQVVVLVTADETGGDSHDGGSRATRAWIDGDLIACECLQRRLERCPS